MINEHFITSLPKIPNINMNSVNDSLSRITRNNSQLPLINSYALNNSNLALNEICQINQIDISAIIKERSPLKLILQERKRQELLNSSNSKEKHMKIKDKILHDCLKDKCYVDVNAKLQSQMKALKAEKNELERRKDKKIQSQLGEMKKVVDFWKAFCTYVSPKIAGQKFHYSRINQEMKDQSFLVNPNKYIRAKSLNNLYSNSKSVQRIFHSRED